MSQCEFYLEVLCEEIPANALPAVRDQLAQGFAGALAEASLSGRIQTLSTVRRVAVIIADLPSRQPDREVEVAGPPLAAAFSADGSPTPAAEGFARAQGVAVEALMVSEGPRGKVVAARKTLPGRAVPDVLAEITQRLIPGLHFPKTMRWGAGRYTFVRPVHRICSVFWEAGTPAPVHLELLGVASGPVTLGHRVIAPGPIAADDAASTGAVVDLLRSAGVVLDPAERERLLRQEADRLAEEVGCTVRPDPGLLAELAELVEYPGLVRGAIEARFLELPREVLIATLRHHQKCFVLERDGEVAPYFLAVCDRSDDPQGWVRQGNEWVAGARLSDASFFFSQDRRRPLESRFEDLERVVFHRRLGSFARKAEAVEQLAATVAGELPEPMAPELLQRACRLLKADLTTAMVGEFPELQGVMGGIYARLDGESEWVWQAVADQYQPAGLDGALPRNPLSAVVGLADRLDSLAALFSVGEIPSGSRDPFALRRAALGAVRICAQAPLPVDLAGAVAAAFALRSESGEDDGTDRATALAGFMADRVRHFLIAVEQIQPDVADAVLATGWGVLPDVVARARALQEVRQEEVFGSLAVAFKRVRNMLSRAGAGVWDPSSLTEESEVELERTVASAERAVAAALEQGRYPQALRALAVVAGPLDRFFTEVLVLCDEERLREARLALLARVDAVFSRLADLSKLATGTV